MKTIVEIFETNPDLLETKEVKELIKQFKYQFDSIKFRQYKYWNKVTDLIMHSELFLKEGKSCKQVVEQINKVSFEDDYVAQI